MDENKNEKDKNTPACNTSLTSRYILSYRRYSSLESYRMTEHLTDVNIVRNRLMTLFGNSNVYDIQLERVESIDVARFMSETEKNNNIKK